MVRGHRLRVPRGSRRFAAALRFAAETPLGQDAPDAAAADP
jgi:hypothetical protein